MRVAPAGAVVWGVLVAAPRRLRTGCPAGRGACPLVRPPAVWSAPLDPGGASGRAALFGAAPAGRRRGPGERRAGRRSPASHARGGRRTDCRRAPGREGRRRAGRGPCLDLRSVRRATWHRWWRHRRVSRTRRVPGRYLWCRGGAWNREGSAGCVRSDRAGARTWVVRPVGRAGRGRFLRPGPEPAASTPNTARATGAMVTAVPRRRPR
jgi:hypothetical protein